MFAKESVQLCRGGRFDIGMCGDERVDAFAQVSIGRPDDCRIAYSRVGADIAFHFGCGDLLATSVYYVRASSLHYNIVGCCEACQVPDAVETVVGERGPVPLIGIPVDLT